MISETRSAVRVQARPSDLLRQTLTGWHERLPSEWRPFFQSVELDFDGFDETSKASRPEPFWPVDGQAPNGQAKKLFKPLFDLNPADVVVTIFGHDPYPQRERATGRAFEQGNLTDWPVDIRKGLRVSRSLKPIAVAAAAFRSDHHPSASIEGHRRDRLRDALRNGTSGLLPPHRCFDDWAAQGVLWVNRALTHTTEADKPAHLRLWKPFTSRLLHILAEQSGELPVVAALWGKPARQLLHEKATVVGRGIQFVTADHPSAPGGSFFRKGNPLLQINQALGPGREIAWIPTGS